MNPAPEHSALAIRLMTAGLWLLIAAAAMHFVTYGLIYVTPRFLASYWGLAHHLPLIMAAFGLYLVDRAVPPSRAGRQLKRWGSLLLIVLAVQLLCETIADVIPHLSNPFSNQWIGAIISTFDWPQLAAVGVGLWFIRKIGRRMRAALDGALPGNGFAITAFMICVGCFVVSTSILMIGTINAISYGLSGGGDALSQAFIEHRWWLVYLHMGCHLIWPVPAVTAIILIQRDLARLKRTRCVACGFDLRGNAEPGCPECGWRRQ